nr:hypothetical protein [Tanacetum cinerariifolium]
MSTQQGIYVVGSKNHPPRLKKDNDVPWSSRLLHLDVLVTETFHERTDDELTDKEIKQMKDDDQAIQTILMGLFEDIYAAVDSCETALAPPSPDRTPALYGYTLDSGDDSSDKDLNKDLSGTSESLYTQTVLTSVVHPPPTRPLPTSPAFACRSGKEISMQLGYIAAMNRWRVASQSTCHLIPPSVIPSLSSPPSL